jgi:anti-sigma regulatory factor (Ser/Thr protein kinase)
MLVDAHGGVRLIEHGGSPLGTGAREVSDLAIVFDIGSTLVLYTDGLVEDRGTDIDDGLDRLRSSLSRRLPGAADLEAVADGVLGDLGRLEGHDDDVALLLVRINASARPIDSFATSLTTVAEVPTVRRDAVDVLRRAGAADQSDVIGLAVTELVANALRHVGSRVDVHVDISADRIVVEVYDIGGRLPRQQHAGPDDEHGRGLAVLDALATRWGVRLVRDGKATWAEFARGRL